MKHINEIENVLTPETKPTSTLTPIEIPSNLKPTTFKEGFGWQRLGIGLITPILSLVLGFSVVGVVLALTGNNPFFVYGEMYGSAFGDGNAFADTLVQAIPLILTGLAVVVAFSVRLWNIGAEGQFFAGAIAATGTALLFDKSLGSLAIPLMMLAGMAGGAIWALIPALLRAFLNVNEIISTLMLNYVITLFAEYLIYGPWRDPQGFNFPLTRTFDEAVWLPTFGTTNVHLGLVFGIVAAIVVGVLLARTVWGYELKVMGDSLTAARYAGINVIRNILLAMLLSGALAGLAGMGQVAGIDHKLQQGVSPGYGFTAIIIAWLARLNVIGVIIVAILFGGLVNSGYAMKTIGISSGFVTLVQGAILFFVLAGEAISRRLYYHQDLKKILSSAVVGRVPE